MNAGADRREPTGGSTERGQARREAILQAALDLFRERGWEETTMRAVAERAGVSLGNAYYYFAGKEQLLQGFYAERQASHEAVLDEVFARERTLEGRLRGVLRAKVETDAPFHRFAGLLFRTAGDPQSPLNPFSPESSATRKQATALMARVLEGTRTRVPKDLKPRLPELLWLFEMGVVLHWVHDRSPGFARTFALIDEAVPLVARLIGLAGNPLMVPLRKRALRLLDAVLGDPPAGA